MNTTKYWARITTSIRIGRRHFSIYPRTHWDYTPEEENYGGAEVIFRMSWLWFSFQFIGGRDADRQPLQEDK